MGSTSMASPQRFTVRGKRSVSLRASSAGCHRRCWHFKSEDPGNTGHVSRSRPRRVRTLLSSPIPKYKSSTARKAHPLDRVLSDSRLAAWPVGAYRDDDGVRTEDIRDRVDQCCLAATGAAGITSTFEPSATRWPLAGFRRAPISSAGPLIRRVRPTRQRPSRPILRIMAIASGKTSRRCAATFLRNGNCDARRARDHAGAGMAG
jgi:hypothetical protein